MADYDCEWCEKHHSAGGKCKRFEYNCPFDNLKTTSMEDVEFIRKEIKFIKDKIKELEQYCEEKNIYGLDDSFYGMKFNMETILESYDDDLYTEWKYINEVEVKK